jgi:hypothetical protein
MAYADTYRTLRPSDLAQEAEYAEILEDVQEVCVKLSSAQFPPSKYVCRWGSIGDSRRTNSFRWLSPRRVHSCAHRFGAVAALQLRRCVQECSKHAILRCNMLNVLRHGVLAA